MPKLISNSRLSSALMYTLKRMLNAKKPKHRKFWDERNRQISRKYYSHLEDETI